MQINDIFKFGDFEDKIAAIAKIRMTIGKEDDSLFLTCLGIEKERMQKLDFDMDIIAVPNALFEAAFNSEEHVLIRWYAIVALISAAKKTDKAVDVPFCELVKLPIYDTADILIELAEYYMEVTRENPNFAGLHAAVGETEIRKKTLETLEYFKGNNVVAEALIKAARCELFVGNQNMTPPDIYAVRALGEVGGGKAIEYLKYLASSHEGEVKQEAQEALAKLGFSCSICQKPLTYIPQYQRWYCYNCKKYAPKDIE
jgi:hypothetical protein